MDIRTVEQRLWFNVLARAICDYVAGPQYWYFEGESLPEWFAAETGPFTDILETLADDPEYCAKKIRAFLKRAVKDGYKMNLMTRKHAK